MSVNRKLHFWATTAFLLILVGMSAPVIVLYLQGEENLAWINRFLYYISSGTLEKKEMQKLGLGIIVFSVLPFAILVIKISDKISGWNLFAVVSRAKPDVSQGGADSEISETSKNRSKANEYGFMHDYAVEDYTIKIYWPVVLYIGLIFLPFFDPFEWAIKLTGVQPFGIPYTYFYAALIAVFLLPLVFLWIHFLKVGVYLEATSTSRFSNILMRMTWLSYGVLAFFCIGRDAPREILRSRRIFAFTFIYAVCLIATVIHLYLSTR